jgi:ABC-type uncharacterized transport system ATPase subunit
MIPSDQLVMRSVTKAFGGKLALDRVDLTLKAGEIHGLLGENGAGKSTLMNVLAGVVRPDAGEVVVGERELRPGSPREAATLGIGMVHQHFSHFPALTVAENLSLAAVGGSNIFCRAADLAAGALERAERLGWRFDPETPVWQLSVGQQQRLEIIKVLQRDARWLLFDEPTAVLSPPEVEELFRVLSRLRREGRTVVFISHKLEEVRRLCDRVTVLRQGRKVGERQRGVTASELARLMVGEAADGVAPSLLNQTTRPAPVVGDTAPVALSLREVRVRGDRGTQAVRGITLQVRSGEIFGVAGVDGNGQRELAEAVVGLRATESGSIEFGASGETNSDVRPRSRVGYIPQDRQHEGLILGMSVRENLALELHAAPELRTGPVIHFSRLWSRTSQLLRTFDVRVADDRLPAAALSGGNQQKIVIARALTGERPLLVAVNPTRGLDVRATEAVHAALRAARGHGTAILLISTELDEILKLSDRVGVLYSGQLQGIVPPTTSRTRIGEMMGGAGGP